MIAFLDLDGVVVNFADSVLKLFGREDLIGRHEWDMAGAMGITEDHFWSRIDAEGVGFWATLPEYPWAGAVIDKCDADIFLLSSPSRSPFSLQGKIEWIRNRFGAGFRDYFLGPRKELLAKRDRMLIDDCDDNISKFCEAGGHGLIFPRCWNLLRGLSADPMGYFYSAFDRVKDRIRTRC